MNPITLLKLYFKLNPIIDREKKLFTMKLTTSTFCQILTGVADIINVVTPITSGNGKLYAGAALAVLHIIINTISHVSNTDGTPQTVAFVEENSNKGK